MGYHGLLSAQLLPILEEKLRKKPEAYRVLGHVQCQLQGVMPWQFYVDRWPEFTTVLVKPAEGQIFEVFARSVHIFSSDWTQGLKFVTEASGMIDWQKRWRFTVLNSSDGRSLQQCLERRGLGRCDENVDQLVCVYVTKADIKDPDPKNSASRHPLPEGYVEDVVTLDDLDIIVPPWTYTPTIGEQTVRELFTILITHYPTVCIRRLHRSPGGDSNKDGGARDVMTPVGWCLQYPHGGLTALHVLPEHRGQGIAQYIVKRISEKIISSTTNEAAWAFYDVTNAPSAPLFAKCGYHTASEETILRFNFIPVTPDTNECIDQNV